MKLKKVWFKIMKLEDIGFYTLSDNRAKTATSSSRIMRCEFIITGRCNFSCPYCRHIGGPDVDFDLMSRNINEVGKHCPFAIRFSGGEPTIHPRLLDMVKMVKDYDAERIAISTNGSADMELYQKLIDVGVNDFSVSLDACCAADAEKMSGGGIKGMWDKFLDNIRNISSQTYLTVGIVLDENNKANANEIIEFAAALGVSDIRVIPAAQDCSVLSDIHINKDLLNKYPILKYRHNNLVQKRPVRGIFEDDTHKCPLVLDDAAIMGDKHYPCIIYMRESGKPIGTVGPNMRQEREEWFKNTDVFQNETCRKNCLDVCKDYNEKWEEFNE